MPVSDAPASIVIVDYGVGNLYSVKHACEQVGLAATISSAPQAIAAASGIVLPGIGAFGDAMATLRRLDLIEPLKDALGAGKPVMGVCLGMQLLMTESHELGSHRGLGVIEGTVEHLGRPRHGAEILKVPHVSWTHIQQCGRSWEGSGLDGVPNRSYMYFVHSFRVQPADSGVVLSQSQYGDITFCSSVQAGSIFACQFHPERSTGLGLQIYRNFGRTVCGASRSDPCNAGGERA
jgi:glutamine amidotransferase